MRESGQLVVFRVGNELYGTDISEVREIIDFVEISRLPDMPEYISGICNLRGRITVIYDLCKRFEIVGDSNTKSKKIIVINDKNLGFVVDEVREILRYEKDDFDLAAFLSTDTGNTFIDGFVKNSGKIIAVINLNQLFTSGEEIDINRKLVK
jgi:purine-binding chemotaxis protein CheW